MKLFLNRLICILFIMIGIVLAANYHSDNDQKELYYDNFKHTSNVILSSVDGFNSYDMEISKLDLHKDDKYISYRLAYEDGGLVNIGDVIKKGESKTLKYIVLYENQVLEDDYHFDSSFNINYGQHF